MGRVKAGSLRLGEAAELLELSYRQTKRIWARFRGGGAKGLQHKNCGRRSNRAYGGISQSGIAAGAGALRRFRPDARDRALGQRRRARPACRDAAIVDDIELMEVCVLRYSYIHYHVSVSRSIC